MVIVLAAFTEEQAARLAGLTVAQLRYWDQTGFFVPSYAEENRRAPYSRLYSFKDLAALRVISVLRNQHNVSLQHLRDVALKLQRLSDTGWTNTTLYVLQKRVLFEEPETGRLREIVGTQYVLPSVALRTVFADTERDAAALMRRANEKVGQISRNRSISHNAPVIAGTRIPTAAIRRFREAGYSTDQIIAEYPDLTPADVEAALEFEANAAA